MAQDALCATVMQPSHCMMTSEVTQAQPITSLSRKQGMNTRSSTKAEVVAADKIISPMIWTSLFLKVQGYPIKDNTLYQDNKSTMLLITNGCKSVLSSPEHPTSMLQTKRPKTTLTSDIV